MSNLWTHIQTIHKGKTFPCQHCEYKATKKQHLKRHTLSKHEGKIAMQ